MEPVILSCAELSTREINAALAALPDGACARVLEPRGRHNLAVGLSNRVGVDIEGNAGYFIGGLGQGPDVVVSGFGASSHGGTIVIEGDASSRAGISLKGGTILVAGNVGHMSGFMAQASVMLIGGDAGDALGDSLYEAVIYVAGKIASLGSDARIEELTEADVRAVKALAELGGPGFGHVQPENVTRVASARGLYNFDALKDQKY